MKAVKFYSTMPSDDENVLRGISGKIPAIVIDTVQSPNYPIDDTYILMTNNEFNDYNASLAVEYQDWRLIQDAQPQVIVL